MKPFASQRPEARRGCCAAVALILTAAAAPLQPLSGVEVRAAPDCDSVVMVKCDPPPAAIRAPQTSADAARRDQKRTLAAHREAAAAAQDLGPVVIEAEAVRARALEEVLAAAFPPGRPVDGFYTYPIAEGGQCTCMNRCPPPPFACCQCSGQLNHYGASPGMSVLH